MPRILLLDCTESLKAGLQSQGFNVELGTVGLCTGIRNLPSQVYEKDIFFYNPEITPSDASIKSDAIINRSPDYDISFLQDRIRSGGTFVAFVNRLSDKINVQRSLYNWIPYMPMIENTSDNIVIGSSFSIYPESNVRYITPIVTPASVAVPVRQKLSPPTPQDYPRDVFPPFWNRRGDCLGVLILRGRGSLIVLPKFTSNAAVIETFIYRVAPHLYPPSGRRTLTNMFSSPAEQAARAKLEKLKSIEIELATRQEEARTKLAAATREKLRIIESDPIAKQILVYYEQARKEDDAALFYLYKIVEGIENKFGGEVAAIKAVGAGTEWKAVKRLANESYRDARHAPRPSDIIKKWTEADIKKCFENVEVVVNSYFSTFFAS